MTVVLEVRDHIARAIGAGGDLSRRALESLLLEEYRAGRLTKSDLQRALDLSYYELDGFLKEPGELIEFTKEEFECQQ